MKTVINRGPSGRTIRCTSHCATCGRHFHSLGSFDAHRYGPMDARICLDPELDEECLDERTGYSRFMALTTEGTCDVYPSRVLRGVVVWTLAASVAAAHGRWDQSPSEGEG